VPGDAPDTANALTSLRGILNPLRETMAHSFTIRLNDELSLVLKRVESGITESGGRFEGNLECGAFAGKSVLGFIKGKYHSLSDEEIRITITDKPLIVPYRTIETEIRKYFS
jgi:hypothetical protein